MYEGNMDKINDRSTQNHMFEIEKLKFVSADHFNVFKL